MTLQPLTLPDYALLEEPKLHFGPDATQTESDPRRGLVRHGPLDINLGLIDKATPVTVGVVSVSNGVQTLLRHLHNLNSSRPKRENDRTGTDYPGFLPVYRRPLRLPESPNSELVHVLDLNTGRNLSFESIVDSYFDAAVDMAKKLPKNSPVVLHVPELLKDFFSVRTPEGRKDLRLAIKARVIDTGICTQLVKDRSTNAGAFDYTNTMWNLSLALYYKAAAVPWRIKPEIDETCYIGVSFAIKQTGGRQEVLIGLAELFNSYGEGITISAIEDRDFRTGRGYHLSHEKMRNLLSSAIDAYSQSLGRTPYRVVVHKSTAFLGDELAGAGEALGEIPQVDLVHVETGSILRLLTNTGFPPQRGTFLKLTEGRGLLYTTGVVPLYGTYPGAHIPAPLEIHKHQGERSIETLAAEVLTLAKMNWNTSNLMSRVPVTLRYSDRIADVMKYRDVRKEKFFDFRLYV